MHHVDVLSRLSELYVERTCLPLSRFLLAHPSKLYQAFSHFHSLLWPILLPEAGEKNRVYVLGPNSRAVLQDRVPSCF